VQAGCRRDGGTKQWWLQVTDTSFGARSVLLNLHLQQLGHNQQNKVSSRSEAEEQRKLYKGTRKALHVCVANVQKRVQCVV